MKNVTDFRKTVEIGVDQRLQYVYNKHNTTWKVLCTILRHQSLMYQISHSFAVLTGSIRQQSVCNTAHAHFSCLKYSIFTIRYF